MKSNSDISWIELIIVIIAFVLLIFGAKKLDNYLNKENKIITCNNVKTFYKDNLLFDKFYITCDNGQTIEIRKADIFAKFQNGENYELHFSRDNTILDVKLIKEENTNES